MLAHESGVGNGRVPLSGADMGERARTREMNRTISTLEKIQVIEPPLKLAFSGKSGLH
jgi:hypothetical protein